MDYKIFGFLIILNLILIKFIFQYKSTKFLLVGDIGIYNEDFYRLIQNEKSIFNDFMIILGDNFYPYGIDNNNRHLWNNIKKLNNILNIPLYSVLGNHDYHKNPNEQIIFKKYNWNMPYYYYYKKIKNIGFWFIDTQILTLEGPDIDKKLIESKIPINGNIKHIKWLEKTLSQSKDEIKIVSGHYPMFSNGNYRKNNKLIKILYPLFKKYNVKIYFSGHDHTFQHLIRNYDNHELHQFIIGSSSEVRNYNLNYNHDDILITKMVSVACEYYSKNLKIKVSDLNKKTIYKTSINF